MTNRFVPRLALSTPPSRNSRPKDFGSCEYLVRRAKPAPHMKYKTDVRGLRELPTELRLKIYKELLVHPGGIHINKKIRTYYETVARHSESCAVVGTCSKRCAIYRLTKQRCPRQPVFPKRCCVETAILATCKSIREEAYDILWKQPWHFSDPETLHSFLMLLGPKTINSLRNITIHQGLYKRDMRHFAFLAPLQYATNLQVLQFGTAIVEIRRDPNSEWQRGHIIAEAFFKKMSPFVRAFTTRRGVEELLQVVKFDGVDMEGSQLVGTWTEEREKIFCDSLRIRLVQLMSR